jgi:hypothetical protein
VLSNRERAGPANSESRCGHTRRQREVRVQHIDFAMRGFEPVQQQSERAQKDRHQSVLCGMRNDNAMDAVAMAFLVKHGPKAGPRDAEEEPSRAEDRNQHMHLVAALS